MKERLEVCEKIGADYRNKLMDMYAEKQSAGRFHSAYTFSDHDFERYGNDKQGMQKNALRMMSERASLGVWAVLLACSVLGWVLLWAMWRLLRNLKAGQIFTEENVLLLQRISTCCAGAAALCVAGCFFYLPFLFAVAAAAFMSLIVRIVRNVFQTALAMKAELDFTV